MATVTTSSFLGLDWRDFAKGALVASLTTPFTILIESFSAGNFQVNWENIGAVALAGFLSYIVKNLFSPSAVKITDVPKETIKAVKENKASAIVMSTNSPG